MQERLVFRIAGGALAPKKAREAIEKVAGTWFPPAFVDLLQLVVSEVVTNSVRHGQAGEQQTVDVDVTLGPERVRVEVVDRGQGFPLRPRAPRRPGAGGWGLNIVDELAERWGVYHSDGTHVWFELAPSTSESVA